MKFGYIAILGISILIVAVMTQMLPAGLLLIILIMSVLLISWRSEFLIYGILLFALLSVMPSLNSEADAFQLLIVPGLTANLFGILRGLIAIVVIIKVALIFVKRFSFVRLNKFFFFLLLYAAISLIWGQPYLLGEGLRLLTEFGLAFGVYYMCINMGAQEGRGIWLIKVFGIFAIITAVGSLLFPNFLSEIAISMASVDRGERLIGITASPNILAGNLTVFIALSTAILVTPRVPRHFRYLSWFVLILSIVPLLLTFSRSGWIGSGLAIALALSFRRRWKVLILFSIAVFFLLFGSQIGNRFLGDWQHAIYESDWANTRGYQNLYGRVEILWLPALRELVTPWSFFVGNGAGMARYWSFSVSGGGLHSELLQNFLNFGFIGTAILLAAFWAILRRSYRLFLIANEPSSSAIGLAAICVVAGMFPKFLWDHLLNAPCSWMMLMICGVANGLGIQVGSPQQPDSLFIHEKETNSNWRGS